MQWQSKPYFPLSGSPSSHLTIFTTICPLLSPSDPIDKSYFVPTFAVSFKVVYTGAGLILSKSRFRTPLAGVAEAPRRAHSRRMPDSPGSCGPLSGKSSEFPLHPWVNPCSNEHGKLCFRRPELFPGVPKHLAAGSNGSLLRSREPQTMYGRACSKNLRNISGNSTLSGSENDKK